MNRFLERLSSADTPFVGTFAMSASPIVVEALACCGFDWMVLDAEHSPLDLMPLVHLLQALGGHDAVPVVRVPWNDTVSIKRVLDAGATTLLVPFVETAEQAAAAVAATRYPPEGVRGMAGLSRASRFGATPDHFRSANGRQGVIVQLETPASLERLEAIADVPGVDALFIGPTDLSGAMGYHGNPMNDEVQAAIRDAVRRCKAVGRPVGTVAGTPELVAGYRRMGFDFVALGSDLAFLVGQARSGIAALCSAEVKRAEAPAPGTSSVY